MIPRRSPARPRLVLFSALLLIAVSASQALGSASPVSATADTRPDWTERASFLFGDDLYAVGVASRAKTIEQGRQKAFEAGKREIENYLQGATLNGLTITTERTYGEPQEDGSVTVWRLLRVSADELRKVPAKRTGAGPGASKVDFTRMKEVDLDKMQTCTSSLTTIPFVALWCWLTW